MQEGGQLVLQNRQARLMQAEEQTAREDGSRIKAGGNANLEYNNCSKYSICLRIESSEQET